MYVSHMATLQKGYRGQRQRKVKINVFEDVSVGFNMLSLPLVILVPLFFLVGQPTIVQPKPGGANLRSLSRRAAKVEPMESLMLAESVQTSSKDLAADFELVRQLDEHQVCFSNPTIALSLSLLKTPADDTPII